MILPARAALLLTEIAHGVGAEGLAFYRYRDTLGLGVYMESRRAKFGQPWKETWRYHALPDRVEDDYETLQLVASAVSEEQVAAERAKWPRIEDVRADPFSNYCRLCSRPNPPPAERPPSTRVLYRTDWYCAHTLSLCDAHFEQYRQDAAGLVAALNSAL